MSNFTTIRIKKSTREKLKQAGIKGEDYDTIVIRLLGKDIDTFVVG